MVLKIFDDRRHLNIKLLGVVENDPVATISGNVFPDCVLQAVQCRFLKAPTFVVNSSGRYQAVNER
jgi:hypothetical protein